MRILIGLILAISMTEPSLSQDLPRRNIVIKEIDAAFMRACEMSAAECKPVEIVRYSINDSVILVFPSGGTVSEVCVSSSKNKKVRLYDRRGSGEGNPTIGLTNLKDGEYSARMLSCGLGGSFMIQLRTQVQ